LSTSASSTCATFHPKTAITRKKKFLVAPSRDEVAPDAFPSAALQAAVTVQMRY
jgi:hypothetical protein